MVVWDDSTQVSCHEFRMRSLALELSYLYLFYLFMIQNICKCFPISFSRIIHLIIYKNKYPSYTSERCVWSVMDWCPVHSNIREPDLLKRSHLCSSASFHSHEVLILGPAVRVPSSFVSICYVLWSKPYCLNVSAWHRVFQVAQQTSQHGRKSESELWCFTGSKNHPSGKAVIKHWLSRTFLSHLFLFFLSRSWKPLPQCPYHILYSLFDCDSSALILGQWSCELIKRSQHPFQALARRSRIVWWEHVTQMLPFYSAVVRHRMSVSVSLEKNE